MEDPIYRAGAWWSLRDDGRWLYWNVTVDRWDHHPYGPPVVRPSGPDVHPVEAPAPAPVATTPVTQPYPQPVAPSGPVPYPSAPPYPSSPPPYFPPPYGPFPPPPPKPAPTWAAGTSVTYADWWQRAVAFLVDLLAVAVPTFIVIRIIDAVTGPGVVDPFSGDVDSQTRDTVRVLAFIACYFVLIPAYFAFGHGSSDRGATLGKRLTKIRVADVYDGSPIGPGRSFLRWVLVGVFWLFLYLPGLLNLLWPLWDPQKQSWHDKLVSSVVVTSPR